MGFVFLQHIYIHFSNSDVPVTGQGPQETKLLPNSSSVATYPHGQYTDL